MSKLALKLIAENKRTRVTFLDLGNCDLTEVPDEIGELVWLEELSFSGVWWILDDHFRMSRRSRNTGRANHIVKLSHCLSQLKQLKTLWLSGEWNKKFELTDLTSLSGLSALQTLIVSNTPVSDLTPLSGLSALQTLYVSNTQVSDLTPLSGLSALQTLYVSGTQVSDLTPLSGLRALQSLAVRNTTVSDLTPLSGLSALQELRVTNTPVSDLMPLSDLSALQLLVVSNTQISDLTPLSGLIKSGLETKWNLGLGKGNGIYIENCPLKQPPPEIVQQGNAAILNYFKEKQQQGTDHLYEAKLLIVGEGKAGKTSLVRRLYQTDKDLPEEKDTTKGIDIHSHTFTCANGREFRLNVWDFGGQEIYHATHQFFLTQRSLYVLLDDTRSNDKTVHDPSFKYWLDVVDFFSNHSPLLIFQNEKGGRSKAIDLAGIKAKFNNVEKCYSGNLEHKNAADGLREAIELFAKQLPHIGEELPAKWINIRAEIEQAAEQQATISQQDYFNLYEKHS